MRRVHACVDDPDGAERRRREGSGEQGPARGGDDCAQSPLRGVVGVVRIEIYQVQAQVRLGVRHVAARAVIRKGRSGGLAGLETDEGHLADDVANEVVA